MREIYIPEMNYFSGISAEPERPGNCLLGTAAMCIVSSVLPVICAGFCLLRDSYAHFSVLNTSRRIIVLP